MAEKYKLKHFWWSLVSSVFGSSLRCLFCPGRCGKFSCYWKTYALKSHCTFIVSIHSPWYPADVMQRENPAFDTTSITISYWWRTVCLNNVCWKLSQKCNFLLILLKVRSHFMALKKQEASLSLNRVFILDYLFVLSYGCRVSWWSLALTLALAFP